MKKNNGFYVPEPGELPEHTSIDNDIENAMFQLKDASILFNLFLTIYEDRSYGGRRERHKAYDDFKSTKINLLENYGLIVRKGNEYFEKTDLYKEVVRNGGWRDYKIKIHQGKPLVGKTKNIMNQKIENNDYSNNKGTITQNNGNGKQHVEINPKPKQSLLQIIYWIVGIIGTVVVIYASIG